MVQPVVVEGLRKRSGSTQALPKVLNGEALEVIPILGLAVFTVAMVMVGLTALRRRDVVA